MYDLANINALSDEVSRKQRQKKDIDIKAEFHENQAKRFREKSKKLEEDISMLVSSKRKMSIGRYQDPDLRKQLIKQGLASDDPSIINAAMTLEESSNKEWDESVTDEVLVLFIKIDMKFSRNKKRKNPLEWIGKLGWKDEDIQVVNEYYIPK